MNPRDIIFFVLFAIALALVIKHDANSILPGERVDCSEKRTLTPGDKLDRLYDLACFETKEVKWRTFFMSAAIGALISVSIIGLKPNMCAPAKVMSCLVPMFVISVLMSNFHGYHGSSRNHPAHAYRLRLDLQKLVLYQDSVENISQLPTDM